MRPFNAREMQLGDDQEVIVMPTAASVVVLVEPAGQSFGHSADGHPGHAGAEQRHFEFDRAYCSADPSARDFASQDVLMAEVGVGLKDCIFEGYNACLFAYGQTGSGKTFSVLGVEKPPELRGLLPRIVELAFEQMECERAAEPPASFDCGVTYVEIYNEQIRNILRPPGDPEERLEVRHSPKVGAYIEGLRALPVFSHLEVQRLMDIGMKTRAVGATCMNDQSSRSHCIFTLEIASARPATGRQVRAKLNLVDLAGSERQARTQSTGARLKEGAAINKSLTTLAMVIHKLAEIYGHGTRRRSSQDFVPFCDSKLTDVLQDSLSGNSRTVMIAAISPAENNIDETVSTLRFAESVKKIKTNPKRNLDSEDDVVFALQAECEALRAQLASHPGVEKEIASREALMASYGEDVETKLAFAAEHLEQCRAALQDRGLSVAEIMGMDVDHDCPQLVNISHDPHLSEALVYFVERRPRLAGSQAQAGLLVGSGQDCDIKLQGLGVQAKMCYVENRNDLELLLTRAPEARVLVNGRAVDWTKALKHGDRVILGFSFCFRVRVPLAADEREEVHDLETALAEVQASREVMGPTYVELEGRGPHVARFVESLGQVAHLVEEANAITQELRPEQDLLFQLEAATDLRLAEPAVLVRLARPDARATAWLGDVPGFLERLEHLRVLYHAAQTEALDLTRIDRDVWREVKPWNLHDLIEELEELGQSDQRLQRLAGEMSRGGASTLLGGNGMSATSEKIRRDAQEARADAAEREAELAARREADARAELASCRAQLASSQAAASKAEADAASAREDLKSALAELRSLREDHLRELRLVEERRDAERRQLSNIDADRIQALEERLESMRQAAAKTTQAAAAPKGARAALRLNGAGSCRAAPALASPSPVRSESPSVPAARASPLQARLAMAETPSVSAPSRASNARSPLQARRAASPVRDSLMAPTDSLGGSSTGSHRAPLRHGSPGRPIYRVSGASTPVYASPPLHSSPLLPRTLGSPSPSLRPAVAAPVVFAVPSKLVLTTVSAHRLASPASPLAHCRPEPVAELRIEPLREARPLGSKGNALLDEDDPLVSLLYADAPRDAFYGRQPAIRGLHLRAQGSVGADADLFACQPSHAELVKAVRQAEGQEVFQLPVRWMALRADGLVLWLQLKSEPLLPSAACELLLERSGGGSAGECVRLRLGGSAALSAPLAEGEGLLRLEAMARCQARLVLEQGGGRTLRDWLRQAAP